MSFREYGLATAAGWRARTRSLAGDVPRRRPGPGCPRDGRGVRARSASPGALRDLRRGVGGERPPGACAQHAALARPLAAARSVAADALDRTHRARPVQSPDGEAPPARSQAHRPGGQAAGPRQHAPGTARADAAEAAEAAAEAEAAAGSRSRGTCAGEEPGWFADDPLEETEDTGGQGKPRRGGPAPPATYHGDGATTPSGDGSPASEAPRTTGVQPRGRPSARPGAFGRGREDPAAGGWCPRVSRVDPCRRRRCRTRAGGGPLRRRGGSLVRPPSACLDPRVLRLSRPSRGTSPALTGGRFHDSSTHAAASAPARRLRGLRGVGSERFPGALARPQRPGLRGGCACDRAGGASPSGRIVRARAMGGGRGRRCHPIGAAATAVPNRRARAPRRSRSPAYPASEISKRAQATRSEAERHDRHEGSRGPGRPGATVPGERARVRPVDPAAVASPYSRFDRSRVPEKNDAMNPSQSRT